MEYALLVAPSLSLVGSVFIACNIYYLNRKRTTTARQHLILWLSLSDFGFALLCVTNVAVTRFSFGKSAVSCTIQGALMEFFASCTWLWSNVIALSYVFSEFRWADRLRTLYSNNHATWILALLFSVPALVFRSQAPTHELCEPADTAYIIFTVELSVCFLFNAIAYAITTFHLRVYAPDIVRTRFARRTSTYMWIFWGCWVVPFIVGIWYTVFDARDLSDWIIDIALVTQSLQGFVNAIAYGTYENVWWRRTPRKEILVVCDDNQIEKDKEEEKKHDDDVLSSVVDGGDGKDTPLLMDYHVSFADPNLKDKDSRRWISRQRKKIALRRAYGDKEPERSPSMRIV